MNWKRTPLKRALLLGGGNSGLIKGGVSNEPTPGLYPGFSASGQDVWLERATFHCPGLVLSAVGARCGKVFEASGEWGTVANTVVLLPTSDYDAHFLWYLTNNESFWEKGGTAQPYVRVEETLNRRVTLPPLPTQRAIAEYLDRETARIDALIAAKQRMVELLAERRRAARETLVAEAWGSGSGIRLGYMLREVDDRLGMVTTAHALLSVSIHHGVIPFAEANPDRQPRADDLANYKRCRVDDIVLNRMRAFQGGIGRATEDGIVSPDYTVLRPSSAGCPRYLNHLLRSPWFVGQMESLLRGIGGVEQGNVRTPRVNWDDLRLVVVPSPSLDKQESLAEDLDRDLATSSEVQTMVERQVGLLQERRHAFITAAVTGEKEIPVVAA